MTGAQLALLWVGWVLAGGSPGPATLAIAGTSMQLGRRMGVVMAFGILAGSACWGIAAALGMGALMQANSWVFAGLRYVGAAYLLFLAIKSLRSAMLKKSTVLETKSPQTAHRVFWKGALIHLTNPKAIFAWGAIYAIVVPSEAGWADLFWMFGFLFSGSILVFVGYAFLFSTAGLVAAYQKARRWFELVFAVVFGTASLKVLTVHL